MMMATLVCFDPTAAATKVYVKVVTALLGLPTLYSEPTQYTIHKSNIAKGNV